MDYDQGRANLLVPLGHLVQWLMTAAMMLIMNQSLKEPLQRGIVFHHHQKVGINEADPVVPPLLEEDGGVVPV